jgi:putative acyl-CoA dehydrogenase
MAYRNPRTRLTTHEVTNQPNPLEDVNLYTGDAILTAACAWSGANLYADRLVCFGARVGSAETQALCVQANRVVPGFLPYDRFGQRIDEVEYHPAYHQLMALGLEAGVSAAAWNVPKAGHALHAALLFLMGSEGPSARKPRRFRQRPVSLRHRVSPVCPASLRLFSLARRALGGILSRSLTVSRD